MAKIHKTNGDSGVDTESFFDIVNIEPSISSTKDFINDIVEGEIDRLENSKELSKGMLQAILLDTQDVIGEFGNSLRDDTTTISSKMNQIQQLEEVALAESIKSFSSKTVDEERLRASNHLLRIAQTLKGTIGQKHRLQLQEDIDFLNPKISKAMSFFVEVFIQTLQENDLPEEYTIKVLESLEIKTFQYAEIMQTLFKGVALSEVPHIHNPFLTSSQNYVEMDYIDIYADPEEVQVTEDDIKAKVDLYRKSLQKDKNISKTKRAIMVNKYRKGLQK